MPEYFLTPQAQADRREIWGYIAQNNPLAADRVSEEILATCETLAEYPHIGHKREDLTDKPLRFFSVYHYLIIYKPETKPLEIIRILSGWRDIADII